MELLPTTSSPTEMRVNMMRGPRLAIMALFFLLIALLVVVAVWSNAAELDEVTSGLGQVIPSREIQFVQNLEGGIVAEILVKEGDTVEQGQVLLRIDDTAAGADLRETQENLDGMRAAVIRLTAEAKGTKLVFPEDFAKEHLDLVDRETELHLSRRSELRSSLSVLRQQRTQRAQDLAELQSRLGSLQKNYRSSMEEYDLTAPLVDKGIVSKVEVLRLERDVTDLESQINATRISIPKARAAISEAEQRIQEKIDNARGQALKELNERRVRLAALEQGKVAEKDRVTRTAVRSPVKGIVKTLYFNTRGGVVKPGETIVEVVPLDDTLLIEAKINPSDVAFLHPGQKAQVKLTAYDFSIYGGLPASLVNISADTILDDQGTSFYLLRGRTDETERRGQDGEPLPIMPGMIAEVDILTGKKTVLEYLMKPFIKARHKAMRER